MTSQITCYANCAKKLKRHNCLLYCVSILSLVKFSSMYNNYFILAVLPVSGEAMLCVLIYGLHTTVTVEFSDRDCL